MKVLHITNNYPTEKFPIFGIFVKEQIDSLTELGVENEVFFIKGREKGKLEYIKSVFRLRKLLSKQYFDIIHCHHVFSALCLLLSGQVKKNNSIVSYQSDLHNEKGKFIYRLIKKYFKIIILKNGSSPSMDRQVHFQSNGVNVDFFKPMNQDYCFKRINLQPNKKYILFVSSSLDRKVKRYDRFPTKLGEYFACKKPVVVTTVGDIPLYFTNKKDVILVEPDNIHSVAEGFKLLIRSEDLHTVLSENSYIWMDRNLNFRNETLKNKLINFISF